MKTILLVLVSALCSHAIAQDVMCNLLTNNTTYWPAPTMTKPDYLQPITDPTFGTKITRIVGNPGDPIPHLSGVAWPADQERHEYSKISVWNCDQSMMYLNRVYPNLWLDGNTYQVLFTRTKPGENVLWSHTEPNMMYHTGPSVNCYLGKWDVVKNVDSNLVDLRAYSYCTFGESEGNFTWDGSKVAIYGLRISDGKYVIFVVDVVKRTKGPDINAPVDFLGRPNLDNCTLSPRGTYIIGNDNYDHLQVWRATDGTLVWSESQYGVPSHFDTQIDQNGDEVIAGVTKTSISGVANSGIVIKRKLSDGTITALTKSGYASHTSGRNLRRPGWVFVTFEEVYNVYPPYTNEIDAVKLDGSRVERICNIRDNNATFQGDTYVDESHGCPSPDGLRIIFASDWNKGTYPVQAYVVDYRDKLIATTVQGSNAGVMSSEPLLIGNYPNPFNPSTKIEFRIVNQGFVSLKVFDVLGREVTTLVNGELSAGSYQETFDASGLNSGVYFYQLRTGAFIATGRMALTK
jgi:hypothetical protein